MKPTSSRIGGQMVTLLIRHFVRNIRAVAVASCIMPKLYQQEVCLIILIRTIVGIYRYM